MQQSKRQRELKMKRREAEKNLHSFRGFYGETFSSWSPRHGKKERNDFGPFGFPAGDSLPDPDDESRRMTMESEFSSEVENRDDVIRGYAKYAKRLSPNPLNPHCVDFLNDNRHWDGTEYPRTQQDMEVQSGVVMFSPRSDGGDNQFRERPPSSARSSMSRTRDYFKDPASIAESDGAAHDVSFDVGFDENQFRPLETSRSSVSMPRFDDSQSREQPLPTTRSWNSDSKRRAFFSEAIGSPNGEFDREPGDGFSVTYQGQYRKGERRPGVEEPEDNDWQERRKQLQINTEREEVIDTSGSEERLRQAGSEESHRENRQAMSNQQPNVGDNSTPQKVQPQEQPAPREEPVYQKPKKPVPITIWRDFISNEPGARFPPEAGRYHLYASYACPGSHRALIVRALKGLEDVVSVTIVHPTWRHTNPDDPRDKHRGWIFGDPDGQPFHNTMGRGGPFPPAYPDNDPDPVLNAFSVRNLYEYAKDTSGKYTIPLLWDTKLNTIVNNESSDISYMLNSCFNDFAQKPELDLYTEDDEEGLDRLNEVSQWLYPMMIHGVYRCGFAKTQRAYDLAIEELTDAFDAADQLLQGQRYLTGDTLTDADIRFFVTLIRFDEVYAFYFRANTRLVLMTPSLLNFCREIYQMPGVANTCQMDQIKAHFFGSHAEWNKYSVVPRGLGFMRYLEMPHDRDEVTGCTMSEC